jgi:carboxyl-terminal processing protease
MRKKLIISFLSGAIILAFLSLGISETDKNKKKRDELYRQVELFSDTLAIIDADYVDEVKSRDLIYGALKGMLASLDPHSQFLDPDTYNDLKVDTEGKFGGIGIEITIKDSLLTVVTPIEDTPAWKAGVKAGDRIVRINNELTRDITLSEAVKKLRGRVGEAVNITALRETENKILEFKMVRDIISIKSIKEARILEDNIGYIRLVEFRENIPQDLRNALGRLSKEGATALILDLRNNPGGLLDVAIKVTEDFIEKGKVIVSTKGRQPAQNYEFISRGVSPNLNIPMVVLINEGSASGSEIVAACLQDYKRALIVGMKSFGKGSVQTVIPLRDGSALRLTTSKYFTPLGKVIHGKGVMPDIVVEEGKIELSSKKDIQEEKSEAVFEQIEDKKKEETKLEKAKDYYKFDNQLMRAIDTLKVMRLAKEINK